MRIVAAQHIGPYEPVGQPLDPYTLAWLNGQDWRIAEHPIEGWDPYNCIIARYEGTRPIRYLALVDPTD